MEKENASDKIIIVDGGSRGLFFAEMLTKNLGRKVTAIAENNPSAHERIRAQLKRIGTPGTSVHATPDEVLMAANYPTLPCGIMKKLWK